MVYRRLATANGSYGALSWTYDGVGNRTGQTLAGVTAPYAYPTTSNRLSTIGGTARVFASDAAGNVASDTRAGVLNAYTYNNANRLKTVTVAAHLKATYTYDAAQHLAIRVLTNMTPSGTIHTVYDRDGNLLMESNGLAAGTTREYIWLPETQIAPTMGSQAGVPRPIAVIDAVNTASPATWYVSTDHLNRPVRMTDGLKATVWQATWKPFGEPQSVAGSATLDARFPGQWFQLESGLHQNWWRHYDPTTGRYTQVDPLRLVNGPSIYGYSGQNPMAKIDKDGRFAGVDDYLIGQAIVEICVAAIPIFFPPKPYTGDCTEEQHKDLQDKINESCGRNLSRCSAKYDSPDLLRMKYDAFISCARARDNINNECFKGGDSGHVNDRNQAYNGAIRCLEEMGQPPR